MDSGCKIIAFGHRRRVGKDTSCNFIKTMLCVKGKRVVKISFAYKLKQVCHELFGWANVREPEYYDSYPAHRDDFIPELGMTVRELWIKFGNDIRQFYCYDTWIKSALQNIKAEVILISDLRYPNEAEYLKSQSALLIKLNRPNVPESNDIADSALKDYRGWDRIIDNDGSLPQLNQLMLDLAREEHLI